MFMQMHYDYLYDDYVVLEVFILCWGGCIVVTIFMFDEVNGWWWKMTYDCYGGTWMMINLLKAFKWVKWSFKMFWKQMTACWGWTLTRHWSSDPLRDPRVSLSRYLPKYSRPLFYTLNTLWSSENGL